jgi:hypothetical protein
MKKLLALASLAVLGGTLGFVASGCGSEKAVSLGPPATGSTSVTEPTGTVPTSVSLEVWFLQGEQLVRQTRSHEATRFVATAAMKALLAGPSPAELAAGLRTSVPAGTKLLGISIKKGVATVDLTSQYQSGGGSLSMKARLAQVVYTLTQFPTVTGVRFAINGQGVTVVGGVPVQSPQTRAMYGGYLPAITVRSPVIGARVTSPVTVSGTADVFEATVSVRIGDSAGHEIARTFTTASCGTGCRGDYSVTVSYSVPRTQPGTIEVFESSAKDGQPVNVQLIPVTLAP